MNVDGAGQTQTGTSGTGLSIGDRVEVTWRGKGHTAIVVQVYPETNAVDVVYEADGSVGRYVNRSSVCSLSSFIKSSYS